MKYTGEYTKEIVFPLGGTGTGSIGLCGNGRFADWEIFNRPSKGSENGYSHFAVRAMDASGNIVAKVLCGDILKDLMGQYRKPNFNGYGYGVSNRTMAGFPHFSEWSFEAEFPFATLTFSAPDFPAIVKLKAFNPFIPMDEDNSGIPAAFFEVEFQNRSDEALTFGAAFSVARNFTGQNTAATVEGGKGVFLQSNEPPASVHYKDLTLLCLTSDAQVQNAWYRGECQDSVATFWREYSEQRRLRERTYEEPSALDHATVCVDFIIDPQECHTVRFLLSWNVPNCYNYWDKKLDEESRGKTWKNYYATKWQDSRASAAYAVKNWEMLAQRSHAFSDAVFSSTLDSVILDAATANLCTLKSPTVLRLEDGTLWGWEGVNENEGSCEGSCTHVWNYAYALPFLFPRLERSLRESEYRYSQFANGMTAFRIKLPLGQEGKRRPCVDGQMGGVIKAYREWKLSGDTEWLRGIWKSVQKALEYAWVDDGEFSWDADRDGVLEGRQHHTLDMELFGPSAWLEGFYLAALKAGAEMAEALGDSPAANTYRSLFAKGSAWTEAHLFNGKYYIQKIDLSDQSLPARFGVGERYWNGEAGEIKYQIGEGCEIDQLCAQWHAHLCGLGDIFDPAHRRVALQSMYQNNFKPTMRGFTNPWRVFVQNDEAGAVMCDYPEGVRKPIIPVPYCEECMSGFEYALGELMLAEGMRDEGMTLIRSIRARSDGKKRNPFNEIECGSNYARAMASWGLIPIMSGFSYDMTQKRIGFHPIQTDKPFRCFWSCAEAWGTVEIDERTIVLTVLEGAIDLLAFDTSLAKQVKRVCCDGKNASFCKNDDHISFASELKVTKKLKVTEKLEFIF